MRMNTNYLIVFIFFFCSPIYGKFSPNPLNSIEINLVGLSFVSNIITDDSHLLIGVASGPDFLEEVTLNLFDPNKLGILDSIQLPLIYSINYLEFIQDNYIVLVGSFLSKTTLFTITITPQNTFVIQSQMDFPANITFMNANSLVSSYLYCILQPNNEPASLHKINLASNPLTSIELVVLDNSYEIANLSLLSFVVSPNEENIICAFDFLNNTNGIYLISIQDGSILSLDSNLYQQVGYFNGSNGYAVIVANETYVVPWNFENFTPSNEIYVLPFSTLLFQGFSDFNSFIIGDIDSSSLNPCPNIDNWSDGASYSILSQLSYKNNVTSFLCDIIYASAASTFDNYVYVCPQNSTIFQYEFI